MAIARELVPTGIRGLDEILLGGLLEGNLVLVEGATGTGKTLLGTEFVYRGITEQQATGTLVSFDTSTARRYRDAARFGWDLATLQREGRLEVICTRPEVLYEDLLSPNSLLVEGLSSRRPHRVFFDGIAMLRALQRADDAPGSGGDAPLHRLFVALERLGAERPGLAVLLAHERPGRWRHRLAVVERLADTVIRLRHSAGASHLPVGRSLEIVKSRGQPVEAGWHSLHVTDRGLRVYRRIHAPPRIALAPPAPVDVRTPLGVPALDELLGGPVPRGSTTLLDGPPGAGKTVLVAQLLEAGARAQGEAGLLVSLDETPAQVVRNAASIGLALGQAVDAGLVQLLHEPPQDLDIHAHFHRIREAVERSGAGRLVIDGLGSYAAALPHRRLLRDFFHAIVDVTRQHAITTVVTRVPSAATRAGASDDLFQSAVDHVVELVAPRADAAQPTLRVVKARGIGHARDPREYEIAAGGLHLLPRGAR